MPLTLTDADIRPISDLRNRFSEISDFVQRGKTVILTKNGYGCMVGWLFYADFAAAVDDLEVRSASAARIERKEIGSFGNSFIKDDFGKGGVGF